jgi:hypothetical protein
MKASYFLPLGGLTVTLVAVVSGFAIGFWRFRSPPHDVVIKEVVLVGATSLPASETAPTSSAALQARAAQCETLGGVLLESAYPGEVLCTPKPSSAAFAPTHGPLASSANAIDAQKARCEGRGGVLIRSALPGDAVCWPTR